MMPTAVVAAVSCSYELLLAELLAAAVGSAPAYAACTATLIQLLLLRLLHCDYCRAYNVIAKTRGQLHAVFIITEYAAGGDLLKLLLRPDTPLGWKHYRHCAHAHNCNLQHQCTVLRYTAVGVACAQTLKFAHCCCYCYCCCCSAAAAATIIEQFRIRVAKEGLEALEYLHLQELIHRDIKSSNFLLDSEWKCKLSDFGMARQVAKDGKMTICGTVSCFNHAAEHSTVGNSALRIDRCSTATANTTAAAAAITVQDEYMAPEMLFDEDFSHPADMFSFGMVLLELITRRKVGEDGFARRSPAKLFALDEDEVRAAAPSDTPPSL
eukprot:20392-Heterococcus_DN1.PRE.6